MYLFFEATVDRLARLYLIEGCHIQQQISWPCQRQLATTLLAQTKNFLDSHQLAWQDLKGLAVFAGPAGFTDLRITHAVANTLAYSLQIPIVNAASDDWQSICCQKLQQGDNMQIVVPNYGRLPI